MVYKFYLKIGLLVKKKSAVYWLNLTNQKEYDKAVEKMKDFNNKNVTIISVKRIFGSTGNSNIYYWNFYLQFKKNIFKTLLFSDTFINAKTKLKLAKKLSDLNSEDAEVVKKKKRLYAAKVISSSSEEEIDNSIKKKKIDNYPKVSQISKNSKQCHILEDKKNCSSEQGNETQYIQFQENYNISSDIHHIEGKLLNIY